MYVYRVINEEHTISYQGPSREAAVEVANNLLNVGIDGEVELRDVEACGHYGHSRWIGREPFDVFLTSASFV